MSTDIPHYCSFRSYRVCSVTVKGLRRPHLCFQSAATWSTVLHSTTVRKASVELVRKILTDTSKVQTELRGKKLHIATINCTN